MDDVALSSDELVDVISGAGEAFQWSSAYRNGLASSIGAAFRSVDLSEDTDRIAVDPESAQQTADEIRAGSDSNGLSARTASTYAQSWKRLTSLAYAWHLAGLEGDNTTFWEDAEHLRVRRHRRRRARTDTYQLADADGAPKKRTLSVDTSSGRAEIRLPSSLTAADIADIARRVLEIDPDD